MDGQPIGAGGEALGAVAVVALDITIEKTKEMRQVPCYVLESTKPIWGGELKNCAVILGTNALESLGFRIVHQDGTTVKPFGQEDDPEEEDKSMAGMSAKSEGQVDDPEDKSTPGVLAISVRHTVRIGPQQTLIADVIVEQEPLSEEQSQMGIVVPKEDELASRECDFAEGLWVGQQNFQVPVTNWGSQPLVLEQGSVIGHIEEAAVIDKNDVIWEESSNPTVRKVTVEDARSCQGEFSAQLTIGDRRNKKA